MLHQLHKLPDDILHINLFIDSPSLEVITLKAIQAKFNIDSQYIREANTITQLTKLKNTCNIKPLKGSRWLIIYDLDGGGNSDNSISQNSVQKALNHISSTGYETTLTIYKTAKYGHFKRVCESAFNKSLGRYAASLYGGRLSQKAITHIAEYYGLGTDEIESYSKFLAQKYSRCPDELCNLFTSIKAGYKITSEQDIIKLIGLGDISIADFILSILTSQPKNAKSRSRILKTRLMYLDNLASELSYSSIQNLILDTLDGFIDIKNSLIAGELHLSNTGFTAPEYYDDKRASRFNRLLRYINTLKYQISLEYLLYARLLFTRDKLNPKIAIFSWIFKIYNLMGTRDNDEQDRKQTLDFSVPVKAFDINNYTITGDKLYAVAQADKMGTASKPKANTSTSKPKSAGKKKQSEPDENEIDAMAILQEMLYGNYTDSDLLSLNNNNNQGGT